MLWNWITLIITEQTSQRALIQSVSFMCHQLNLRVSIGILWEIKDQKKKKKKNYQMWIPNFLRYSRKGSACKLTFGTFTPGVVWMGICVYDNSLLCCLIRDLGKIFFFLTKRFCSLKMFETNCSNPCSLRFNSCIPVDFIAKNLS